MALHVLVCKALPTVVTGVVGVAAYEGLRKVVGKAPLRKATVVATAWGIRVVREAGAGAEQARLTVADVVAEAKERAGDQAPPL
ncbi:DUF1490 family protein, partial [Mycobacterium intracellulare]|uniref:DUF1490 family protein n=1 Tax=Mycobacterium intracellulare TaxID=1767 RepID=UPI0006CA6BEC